MSTQDKEREDFIAWVRTHEDTHGALDEGSAWAAWQAARRAPAAPQAVPISDELPQGFISDVLTAAGLVRHGKQCKALADRLGDAIEKVWTTSIAQRKAIAAAPLPPEAAVNIRNGAPYDNPAFEQLARTMGIWGTAQAALCAQFWIAAAQQGVQTIKANCYSNDDGDYWRDCPDDCDFVEGLKVGDTFELQASVRAWSETFRVTKAPDETSDDYEVELVSSDAPTHPTQQGLDAQQYKLLDHGELIEAGDQFLRDDFTWQIDPNGIFVGQPHGIALRPARRAIAAQAKQGEQEYG